MGCKSGNEIYEQQRNDLLRLSVEIPSQEEVIKIWDALDSKVLSCMQNSELNDKNFENLINNIRDLFKNEYSQDQIDYVIEIYIKCLSDDDKAH